MSSNFDKTHNQFCKVYVTNKKKTDTFYWGYFTKSMVNKDFKELVKSNEWDVIVVDDITKEEFYKRIKKYTPYG